VDTAGSRVARIVRTRITVVAVHRLAEDAGPLLANVPQTAGISILTGVAFVVRYERALPTVRVAVCLQTDGVVALRFRALDSRVGVHTALEGQFARIADKGSVAHVPVFQHRTILVGLTVARDLYAQALPADAFIPQCTRIPVVASEFVGLKSAPSVPGAEVVGAGVVVFALHRIADAHPLYAVVRHSARVFIRAFALVQRQLLAARLPHTNIVGAVVSVVAEVDVVSG